MKTFRVNIERVALVSLVTFCISMFALVIFNDLGESFYVARNISTGVATVSFLTALCCLGLEVSN